jgi:putative ABC transport system permease protein
MGTLWQDLRFGLRVLAKQPAFTLVAIVTLALGVGANTAIFSVVNGVLLRSLPYPDPDRLVVLWEADAKSRQIHVSQPNFEDWRAGQQSFESVSAHTGRWGGPATVTGGSEPERAHAVGVFQDFFRVLGVEPAAGRAFAPDEHRAGAARVVVVSHGFWQRRLGGASDLAGRRLTIEGLSHEIVGVLPAGFAYPAETDLWFPQETAGDGGARSAKNFAVVARLKQDVTVEQAQADMTTVARRLEQQYPDSNRGAGVAVVPLKDQLVGQVRPALLVLMAAVCVVLLIACANVANLLLARGLSRQREIAIRLALGAGRARIVRQLLTESLLLSVVGGALGLLFALWLVRALVALGPATIPRLEEIGLDSHAMAFTAAATLLTGLLYGLAPALKISRPDLQDTLKSTGATTAGGGSRLRGLLVVAEVAMTLVLLVGAGLLAKSFWRLLQVSPGFEAENVLTMQLSLPTSDYREGRQTVAFYRQLFERLGALPGVEAAGMINNLPMGGVSISGGVIVEGRPEGQGGYAGFRIVSPGYFDAMRVPVVRGRLFNEADNETAQPVALVSERAARATWPGEDPIGKRVRSTMDNRGDVWMTVVGIVGDVRHSGLEANPSAELYVPVAQRPTRARGGTVVVRTTGDANALAASVRREVQAVDRNLPVSFAPMREVFARTTASRRYSMTVLVAFACAALLLSVVGLYGVMSYTVSQSTREIGLRVALGAQRSDIYRLVVGQGLVLAAAGVCIGIVASLALTRLMAGLLYGVAPTDPATYAGVAALLVVVAALACFVPARRAAKVDPMIALRYE